MEYPVKPVKPVWVSLTKHLVSEAAGRATVLSIKPKIDFLFFFPSSVFFFYE